uniref:Uncharacterized protein n=1 Tax=Rhizophagus irregularis (strain DAOM 181602 / DAOM 197198 / MUCL 43194) TaxID=747089 RepID=U9TPP2_RHIID
MFMFKTNNNHTFKGNLYTVHIISFYVGTLKFCLARAWLTGSTLNNNSLIIVDIVNNS